MPVISPRLPQLNLIPTRITWWELGGCGLRLRTSPTVEITRIAGPRLDSKILLGSEVLIIESPEVEKPHLLNTINAALAIPARPPALLITEFRHEKPPQSLSCLKVQEVARTGEPSGSLLGKALKLSSASERRLFATGLTRNMKACELAWMAIQKAFFAEAATCRVSELANSCFVSVRTLERKWVAAQTNEQPMAVKSLLDWALIVRAREMDQLGLPRLETAYMLGLHERTLRRLCTRVLGVSWRAVSDLSTEELLKVAFP